MKLKHILFSHRLLSKRTIPPSHIHPKTLTTTTTSTSTSTSAPSLHHLKTPNPHHPISPNPNPTNPISLFPRNLHSLQAPSPSVQHHESEAETEPQAEAEDDGVMTEFLSRFVWIMRGKLAEAYPDCDKSTIHGMLLIIAERVVEEVEKGGDSVAGSGPGSDDFSEDLWRTVWEVSQMVLEDMKKGRNKEKMKMYIQSEEVKEMCRFASEVGVRGTMLREFRFKWAKEKMEEVEFYESLERMREEARAYEREGEEGEANEREAEVVEDGTVVGVAEKAKVVELPQRRGKIKYKIYGLDLSDPKWAEVAHKTHEHEKQFVPEDPKPITGKCKLVTEKILNLTLEDDPRSLLAEWTELLKPNRVDWSLLLGRLKEGNEGLYFKIYEQLLDENSFQAGIRDYSRLIDGHAKADRIDEADRIIHKMNEKGIQPDILTTIILLHMYSKAGNIGRATESFKGLKSLGFQPDMKVYSSMFMAYVNAGDAKEAETLVREMENSNMKLTEEMYLALLRLYSERGLVDGVNRITTMMQFSGVPQSLESCTLVVEACARAGEQERAKENFDYMREKGYKPDDRCTASLISVYEKKNYLDRALDILLELEKDGFKPGVATYTVLVDWLGKLQLIDEAEDILRKITENVDTPPLKVQVSLCDMYSRAKDEKKALRALGIIEGKKDQLGVDDFERVINGLLAGGLLQDASRVKQMMEARGFTVSDSLKVSLSSQAIRQQRPIRDIKSRRILGRD